jgi:hypothetical protein
MDIHDPIVTNEEREALLHKDCPTPPRGNRLLIRMMWSSLCCTWMQVLRNLSGWVRSVMH